MADKLAIWISCGSLVVAIASAVIAWRAKVQARRAATLAPRTEAIQHLRHALYDVNRNAILANRETVESIQKAMHLAALAFNRKIRNELERAYMTASRLNMPPHQQRTEKDENDLRGLRADLQSLINDMNQAATLG
jgi:hypothetical protein